MALRKIVLQGDECLTKVCRPVTEFNQRLHTLIDDMKETLLDSGGVGLAAPQVGVLRRVCVVMNEDEDIIELVNPEIIAAEGEQTGLEGCLSIPGKFGIVTRPYTVRVRAQDRDGNFFEVEDEELTARCFCHDIEHLDGHLFVEHTDHLMTEEGLGEYMSRREEDEGWGSCLWERRTSPWPLCAGWWRTATRYAASLPSRISPRTGAISWPSPR